MAEEPSPIELPEIVRALQCEVCGYQKWRIRGMVICKNCHWRAEEAARAEKEGREPWTP